jgi:hypothetical protein
MTCVPFPANTSSNAPGELAVTVADHELELPGLPAEAHQ